MILLVKYLKTKIIFILLRQLLENVLQRVNLHNSQESDRNKYFFKLWMITFNIYIL